MKILIRVCLKDLKDDEIQRYLNTGTIEILGNKLEPDDIRVMYSFKGQSADAEKKYEAHSSGQVAKHKIIAQFSLIKTICIFRSLFYWT